MIRMLPEGLFFDFVVRIGCIFAGLLAVLLVLSFIPRIMKKKRN